MKKQLVYDYPTRIFHWLFAALFLTAFAIAKTIDDDSPIFSFHSIAGLTLGFVVLLRIVWGFVGSRHARFSNFALKPQELIQYFWGILRGDKKKWAGHNPASSWAAIVMMLLALGLGLTGYLMTSGPDKEIYEDVHELMANGFMVVVLLHVAGIALHTVRHQELIGLSMVDGRKNDVSESDQITSARPGVAILFVALVLVFGSHLYKNFDAQTGKLNFFGTSLAIGEGADGGGESGGDSGDNEAEDED